MDDALRVRRFQRLANLLRDGQRLVQGDRALRDTIRERRALDEFHHQRADPVRVFEAVDVRDVRMVERGQHLRFAAEPREAVGVVRHLREQDLDRDLAMQVRIARPIDFAHAPGAQQGNDFVRAETSAGGERHPG
jgi:hypothetical protein